MMKASWSSLPKPQIGAYAEILVKMELMRYGLRVYSPEVDFFGLDFVGNFAGGAYLEFQVKSVRNLPAYIFVQKKNFVLRPSLYLALVYFSDAGQPAMYLIPSLTWRTTSKIFASRDYGEGRKSLPEWGLCLNGKSVPTLEPYKLDKIVVALAARGGRGSPDSVGNSCAQRP
jgi:hypothetical protein